MHLAQVKLHLGSAEFGMTRAHAADIGRKQRLETLAALGGQLLIADPGGLDPPVVVECGGEEFRGEFLTIVARCRSSYESARISA